MILHPHRCLCCNAVDSFKVIYISSYKLKILFVIKIQVCCFFFSDFACRNCLVMSDLSVKVGDYGVAEDHYRVSNFIL